MANLLEDKCSEIIQRFSTSHLIVERLGVGAPISDDDIAWASGKKALEQFSLQFPYIQTL